MSKPMLTKQMLLDEKACADQVELFESKFGESVVVTVSKAKKVAGLFDWRHATRLLDDAAWAEYKRALASALPEDFFTIMTAWYEYVRDTAPARADFKRDTAAARAEYERVESTDLVNCHFARTPARDEYNRAIAPAWANLDRDTAPAHAKYKHTMQSALAGFKHPTAPERAEYSLAMAAAFAKAFIGMHKRGNA